MKIQLRDIVLSGLFIVFVYMKLANVGVVANWSWWWVTAPLTIDAAVCFVFSILAIILTALGTVAFARKTVRRATLG